MIVIVVIAILAAIIVVAFNGIQARARDTQRQTNMAAVAKQLETYYVDNGHYPPFNQSGVGLGSSSWRQANMPELSRSLLTPPGSSSVSIVNNVSPEHDEYGYHNAGSCTGVTCPRFRLYWRSDVDNTVRVINSLNN